MTQNHAQLVMITQVQQKAWETLYNPHDAGFQLLSQKSAHILSRKELKQAFQTTEATSEAGSDHPAEISTKKSACLNNQILFEIITRNTTSSDLIIDINYARVWLHGHNLYANKTFDHILQQCRNGFHSPICKIYS